MFVSASRWWGTPNQGLKQKFGELSFGRGLSHALGIIIFFQLCLSRIFEVQFAGHPEVVFYPIRALAIFALIRGIGRKGRLRPTVWDVAYIGFLSLYLFGAVLAELLLVKRFTSLTNMTQAVALADGYFYYIVLRDGLQREGFSLKIVMYYWLAAYAVGIVIAGLQVSNFKGFAGRLDAWVDQAGANAMMDGPPQPWQARGLLSHANALAGQLQLAIALCLGPLYQRASRPTLWLLILGAVAMSFMTYSRTGLVVLFASGIAWALFLFVRKQKKAARIVSFGALLTIVVGFSLVFALDIKRYKEIFDRGPVKSSAAEDSVRRRARMSELAFRSANELSPVFGVTAADPGIQSVHAVSESLYSPGLVIFNQYADIFVRYGAVGILWLASLLGYMMGMIRKSMATHPFALSAFIAGLATVIHGATENLATDYLYMMQINLIVALAVGVTSVTAKPVQQRRPFGIALPQKST